MSSVYELVELTSGEIALRRADDELHEPLVTIRFSKESLSLLGKSKFAVAKAMIDAAMDAASEEDEFEEEFDLSSEPEIHQLH